MKKISKRQLTGSIIFLVMMLSALLLVYPVYKRISKEISQHVEKFCAEFETKTGLKLNYKSISPSILAGIKINSVSFSNAAKTEENNKILEIDSIYLGYNLWKLITGNVKEAFSELTIDGIVFDFNKDNDFYVLQKISDYLKTLSAGDKKTTVSEDSQIKNIDFPIDVNVKNIELRYGQGETKVSAFLKKVSVDYSFEKYSFGIISEGNVVFNNGIKNYSGRFSASGNVNEKLSGSSLIIRLSNLTDGELTVGRLNFFLSYLNDIFEVKTVQNNYPLYILGRLNSRTKKAELSIQANKLTASSLITDSNNTSLFSKIENSSLNLDCVVGYEIDTKKLSYRTTGDLNISEKAVKGGFITAFSVSGNEKSVKVERFNAFSDNIDVEFEGSLIFKTLGLSGTAWINKVALGNGSPISTEIYFDPLDSGFQGFAPQIFIGDKTLTAMQLSLVPQSDSIDIDFEVSDYSHEDAESPGMIKIQGSYLQESKYFQATVGLSQLFLDSIAQTGISVVNASNKSKFSFLEKYMLNGEVFVSSDLKSFTFNIPYAFAANVKSDDEFLYLSLDGSSNSVQVSRCDYIKNGKKSSLLAQFDKNPDSNDAFVSINLNVNSIPYNFTGTVMPDVISLNGDYGVSLELYNSSKNRYDGVLSMECLPVSIGEAVYSIAADTVLSFTPEDGFGLQIASMSLSETTAKTGYNPHLNLKGSVSKYGVSLDEILYSDIYSSLQGKASGSWAIKDGIFESCALDLNLKNPDSTESVLFTAQVSNPDKEDLNGINFKRALFINTQVIINNFNLNRFAVEQSENNSMTATMAVTGNLEDPSIGLNVDNVSLMLSGNVLSTKFTAFVEDKKASVKDFYLKNNELVVEDVEAELDLKTFTGKAKALLKGEVVRQTFETPLEIGIKGVKNSEELAIPDEFDIHVLAKNVKGTLFHNHFSAELDIKYTTEKITFRTSDFIGIQGTYKKNGDLYVNSPEGKPVSFVAEGNIGKKDIFVNVSNIDVNGKILFGNLNLEVLNVYDGHLKGNIMITGLRSDPYFQGKIDGTGIEFNLPVIVPSHITIPKTVLNFEHNIISMNRVWGKVKKDAPVSAEMKIYFDRWALDRIEANIYSEDNYVPADLDVGVAQFTGQARINLDLLYQIGYLDVTGDVYVRKTNARTKKKETNSKPKKKGMVVRTDVNIYLGQHVNFQFDPILRCLFAPDSMFKFKWDGEDGSFSVDGTVDLRSGDIAYLNRSFYLKKGTLKFNGNDPDFNPIITVKAETRERDEEGTEVRIILTAENQHLSNFTPQFSSVPAKSETEIRTLLGQIATGDSDNVTGLLLATSDYAVQSLLGRNVENKLRDFFNFDILSIRTMVLQNALKSSLHTDKYKDYDLTIGNLLDNSTVYIGKYLGSSLYVDALMHWSFDEARINDSMTPGGLVFKPEFGLEIEAPFANIRWNMAPEFTNSLDKKLVSSTSVTLSWKFSF